MSKELVASYVGELPDGWVLATIGELITPEGVFIDGDWVESKDQDPDGDVRLLQLADIGDGIYKNKSSRFLTMESAVELRCTFLKKGDVLLARMPDPLGRACIFPGDEKECVTVVDVCVIRTGTDDVGHKWLMYWVNSPTFRNTIASLESGTTRRRISRGNLATITFPVPPPEQQKRIVAKIEELFSHIDAGIAALNKTKKLLKQYRQSVLKAAVTGELTKQWREENKDKLEPANQLLERILKERDKEYARKVAVWETVLAEWKASGEQGKKPSKPQKYKSLENSFTDLVELPRGWCWTKLGNLAVDIFDGPFGSNLKSSDYVDDGVRVIRLENIGSLEFKDNKRTYVTEEKYQLLKKHTVSSGDIIFSSFVADGTRVVVLPDNVTKAINKADCFCVRAFGASINETYLANFLSTNSTYKRLKNQVHGATRPRINTSQLKELEVPVCPAEEQLEIVRLTKEKFESIERLEHDIDLQLIKANKNKQSILASAFSGEL